VRWFGVLLISVVCAAPASAQQDTAWSALYLRDLDSLHAAVGANHPGAVDEQNPEFARTLQRAYAEARALAPQVTSFASFRVALTRFINQFEDEHLRVNFPRQVDSVSEAGIIVSYRNGGFEVADVHQRYVNASELMGARLLSCAGEAARDVFRNRVLWWRGRPAIEADWHRQAAFFFIDYGPPTPRAPQSCVFETRAGTVTQQLAWQTTPVAALNAVLQRANPSTSHELGSERIGANDLWVYLPTFSANREPQLAGMRGVLDSLRAFIATNANWRTIVFDLRGNSGGSSSWGDEIAGILFGDEWRRQATSYLYDGVYTEWRLSRDNIRSMRGIQEQLAKREGAESQRTLDFKAFVDSAQAQLERGMKYIGTRQTRTGAAPPPAVAVPGRIVVITTPSCFSACLDFLDRMRLHPAVVQVGETTGVDTNYMENWGGPISTLTSWSYPMKVYRNRRRANNEAYPPHVRYEGSLADDDALRRWVLQLK
jgi:hypothetical protein